MHLIDFDVFVLQKGQLSFAGRQHIAHLDVSARRRDCSLHLCHALQVFCKLSSNLLQIFKSIWLSACFLFVENMQANPDTQSTKGTNSLAFSSIGSHI